MRAIILILLMAFSSVLAGCVAQTTQAQAPVDTAQVIMPPSYRFDPPVIRVTAGTTVTWRNDDHFTHSVRVVRGEFPFLNLPPGQSGSITFDQVGEYDYICTYHTQNMKGKVIVVSR